MCLVTMENPTEAPPEGKTEQPYGTQLHSFFLFKETGAMTSNDIRHNM